MRKKPRFLNSVIKSHIICLLFLLPFSEIMSSAKVPKPSSLKFEFFSDFKSIRISMKTPRLKKISLSSLLYKIEGLCLGDEILCLRDVTFSLFLEQVVLWSILAKGVLLKL